MWIELSGPDGYQRHVHPQCSGRTGCSHPDVNGRARSRQDGYHWHVLPRGCEPGWGWDDWSLYTGRSHANPPRFTFESIQSPTGWPCSLIKRQLITQQGPQGDEGTGTPVPGRYAYGFWWYAFVLFKGLEDCCFLRACSGPVGGIGSGRLLFVREIGPPGPLHFDSGVKIH